MSNRKFTNAERGIIRKAITAHPDWKDYRASHRISAADLSNSSELNAACAALKIDIAAALRDGASEARSEAQNAFERIKRPVPVETASASPKAPSAPVADLDAAFGALKAALGTTAIDEDAIRRIAREEAERCLEPVEVETVVLETAQGERRKAKGITHPKFKALLIAAQARDFGGTRLNTMLCGPAGTGKSFAASQLAELLALPFFFQSIAVEPFDLTGFVDAGGKYHQTPFVRAFREGGVCLLDELDAWEAGALLAINAPLANGKMSLPNGEIIDRHPDFVCVAATNTFGQGATAEYNARNKLDGATLSRFSVKLDWHYHAETEMLLAGDCEVSQSWTAEIQTVRGIMAAAGMPAIADPRTMQAGAGLIKAGLSRDEARDVTYLAGLDNDQRKAILSALKAKGF